MIALVKSMIIMGLLYYGFTYFILYKEERRTISRSVLLLSLIFFSFIVLFSIHKALSVIVFSLLIGGILYHKNQQKYLGKRIIEFYGYKIFKFLMNQIASGILVSEAIKAMYRVVDEKKLRLCLIEVAAYYSKTNDLVAALGILKKAYKSLEVDTLCMAIEQGIHTGTNMETLNKIETLLFKRYIHQIQLETKWRKKRSLLSVLLLCLILILMISIPVVTDIASALKHIFIY